MSIRSRAQLPVPPSSGSGMTREQQNTVIESMSIMECDTPVYDDFVRDFAAAHSGSSRPVASLARRFCETWPVAGSQRIQQRSRVDGPGPCGSGDGSSSAEDGSRSGAEDGGSGAEDGGSAEEDGSSTEEDGGSAGRRAGPSTIRVGVMDSSFNPPHYCHGAYMECLGIMELMPAGGAQRARMLDIDAFLLLLGLENADKRLKEPSLEQRMRMVDMLATTVVEDTTAATWHLWKSRDQFDASNLHNMAIGMVNTPRFVDKCKAVDDLVRRAWGEQAAGGEGGAAADLQVLSYFAMGWDTLIRVFDPKYYSDFPGELDEFFASGGRIAYSRRVGFPDADVEAFFNRPEMACYLQFIFELKLPKRVKHISSSDVRIAVRDSTQSVRDIPPRILEFVNSCQLYRKG
ncbi:hypothetical protein GGF46_003233 [Coemansia sp. RSA 552]|nr:hypothetical protein GGF46_003233 [Coemansia sp. RSA 552]